MLTENYSEMVSFPFFFYSRPESIASEDSLEYFIEDEIVEFDLVTRLFLNSTRT